MFSFFVTKACVGGLINNKRADMEGRRGMQEFEELYRTYYPQIYRYLLKLCQDEALAEEESRRKHSLRC